MGKFPAGGTWQSARTKSLTGLPDGNNMKKRTAASTILMSLVAVTGCNKGDGEYVVYEKTSPSEFEENQKYHSDANPETVKNNDVAATESTGVTPNEADDSKSAGSTAIPTDSDAVSVKPASHSINSDGTDFANPNEVKSIVSPQSGLTGLADTPEIDNAATPVENKIELLIPEKSFRREKGTDAVRISYDDIDLLKVLNMEPVPPNAVDYFPEWLSSLNGKQIRIRGFMYPKFINEGIVDFTLARDNGICCFQRMPKIYDVIFVKLKKGETTDYIDARPFDVEGTFRFDNEGDGTELPRLYKIENARVLD
ncbi:MAG: hypothetical protein O2856_18000 [Planctomycetota bacterium]|nr:hypothetical protein [Planctomycetota bacterium]